uniref:Uncharacterized protein n=1 Tax=viral metagenome TaxID=1070528 RepID=A0A6C0HHP3_9ZZZZ
MLNSLKLHLSKITRYPTTTNQNTYVNTYANLIPVILIAMFILYEDNMAYVANSHLGKVIPILLIVYYTSISIIHGLLACSFVILYYQYNYIKTNDLTGSFAMSESFSMMRSSDDSVVANFKVQNCENGTLMHKGSPVNLEMLEHIYPDINFKNEKCNPCADTCDFSIIEEQLKAEESLKPKTSDEFSISEMWGKMTEFIPALWLKSEPFSSLSENSDELIISKNKIT